MECAATAIIMQEGEPTKTGQHSPPSGRRLSCAPPAVSSASACQAQSLPLPHKEYFHIYPYGWMNVASDEHCSSTKQRDRCAGERLFNPMELTVTDRALL